MKKKFEFFIDILRKIFKRIYLVGGLVTYYSVYKIFINKLKEDEIFERSSAVAFSFTIASFPLIIFLFTLIPFYFFIENYINIKMIKKINFGIKIHIQKSLLKLEF